MNGEMLLDMVANRRDVERIMTTPVSREKEQGRGQLGEGLEDKASWGRGWLI